MSEHVIHVGPDICPSCGKTAVEAVPLCVNCKRPLSKRSPTCISHEVRAGRETPRGRRPAPLVPLDTLPDVPASSWTQRCVECGCVWGIAEDGSQWMNP